MMCLEGAESIILFKLFQLCNYKLVLLIMTLHQVAITTTSKLSILDRENSVVPIAHNVVP